jgi:hypothetical protein
MESFFDTSFADVRVHVGQEASSIGALAFTHGTDLYFAPGQYNPQSSQGQQLLGHELTHVLQQRAGRVRNPLGAGVAVVQDPALEAEAERMGLRAASSVVPIQAKRAGTAPILGPLRAAGFGPNAVAANGAILPPATQAQDSMQRQAGPLLPRKPPASTKRVPGIHSPFGAIQRMEVTHEGMRDRFNQKLTEAMLRRERIPEKRKNRWAAGTRAKKRLWGLKEEFELTYESLLEAGRTDPELYLQALTGDAGQRAIPDALSLSRGETRNEIGMKQDALDLVRACKLTFGEIAAIKIYTGGDYKYINPSLAKNNAWLRIKNGTYLTIWSEYSLRQQGMKHAAHMLSAMDKLPIIKTTVYRGARVTPEEWYNQYSNIKVISFPYFLSSTTDVDKACSAANGDLEEDTKTLAGRVVSIVFIFEVTNGRNIEPLSITGGEKEVLLLPGATFTVTGIEELQRDPAKYNKYTQKGPSTALTEAWYKVYARQTK